MTTLSTLCRARPGQVWRVKLVGTLTGAVGEALLDHLRLTVGEAGIAIAVDMSGVSGIDPRGGDALVDAYVATSLRGGSFVLVGPTERCRAALAARSDLAVIGIVDGPAPASQSRAEKAFQGEP